MRVLALDVGDRRVGLAISDPTGLLASPLGHVERGPTDVQDIIRVAEDNDAAQIVVGLPLTLAGESRAQAGKVRGFVRELRSATDIPVETVDERLSTVQAQRLLTDSDGVRVVAPTETGAESTPQPPPSSYRRTWTLGGRSGSASVVVARIAGV